MTLIGLLSISFFTGALVLLIKLLGKKISRTFNAEWKYWIWLIVALRLVLPFSVNIQIPVQIPAFLIGPESAKMEYANNLYYFQIKNCQKTREVVK